MRPYLKKPFTKKGCWSGSRYRTGVQAPVPPKKKKREREREREKEKARTGFHLKLKIHGLGSPSERSKGWDATRAEG
jgi:hypothetical protein